ncbi:related to dioxygenase [Fusarium mangiferae]|uniref:Related to dioxygenase n=1 Tax=Fusarium mangiferae TaxID=192010 RepID=A0A1L7U2P0_FUSMA|nr:uncharacterized protein FMAN_13029 [Fusarium mangiferae]CVL05060.1 related to dioxygenase [Fusarium mangiferae]
MSIPRSDKPAGASTPYIIPSHKGESLTLPGAKSAIRILASAKESEGLISVFHMDGVLGDPAGFHYHNHAHDVFTCTRGQLKVWAGDKCRILSPGDFCYVPPGIVHQPQLLGPYNETLGLVTPGQWVDFFRFISEQYDGVLAPEFDSRNAMAALGPKIGEITKNYDVIFRPDFVGAEVGEWTEDDTKLPESIQAYYLKADTGPRYLLGGILSRPFITTAQNNGQFSMTSIESSNMLGGNVLKHAFSFKHVHQVYCVLDGAISVSVDGQVGQVGAGDTIFIPAGTQVTVQFEAKYVRFWSFASGDGLEKVIEEAGGSFEGVIVPDEARQVDAGKVREVAEALNASFELGNVQEHKL